MYYKGILLSSLKQLLPTHKEIYFKIIFFIIPKLPITASRNFKSTLASVTHWAASQQKITDKKACFITKHVNPPQIQRIQNVSH